MPIQLALVVSGYWDKLNFTLHYMHTKDKAVLYVNFVIKVYFKNVCYAFLMNYLIKDCYEKLAR